MSRTAHAIAALAALVAMAAPAAAQQAVVFTVDPGSAPLAATLDAIGTGAGTFAASGTLAATIALDDGRVVAFDPTGGVLRLTPAGPLVAVFGTGFGDAGGPHVALALAALPTDAVLVGPPRDAPAAGPGASSLPLAGLSLELVAGGYTASGEVFEQPVLVAVDFAESPATLPLTSGTGTIHLAANEATLVLPVALGVLAVPAPLAVPLRLAGELVLRAPLCGAGACPPACGDGIDNDGDGAVDHPADGGCASAADVSERDASRACDDGLDDDGDGLVDYDPAGGGDPVCIAADFPRESSRCQNGIDDDERTGTDFDGGTSILGPGNGDPRGPDPQCVGKPQRDTEAQSCGLGAELAAVVAALARLRRRGTPRSARA